MLSAKKVERVKAKGRYGDGEVKGLYLQVTARGAKCWLLRYEIDGRKRWMGLGSAADFSLKEARERARLARQKIADKIDPLELRRAERIKQAQASARALTFREAAQRYFDANASAWSNARHREQFNSSLATYVHPIIGNLDVANIDTADVLRVLEQQVAAERALARGAVLGRAHQDRRPHPPPHRPGAGLGQRARASPVRGTESGPLEGAPRSSAARAGRRRQDRSPPRPALRPRARADGQARQPPGQRRAGADVHDPDGGALERNVGREMVRVRSRHRDSGPYQPSA